MSDKCAAGYTSPKGLSCPECGATADDFCGLLNEPVPENYAEFTAALDKAVAAERERCAKIADNAAAAYMHPIGTYDKASMNTAAGIARSIRADADLARLQSLADPNDPNFHEGRRSVLARLENPDEALVDYILRYGGRCRECADSAECKPVCPSNGLPCGEGQQAVKHVLKAVAYGLTNGFLTLTEGQESSDDSRG